MNGNEKAPDFLDEMLSAAPAIESESDEPDGVDEVEQTETVVKDPEPAPEVVKAPAVEATTAHESGNTVPLAALMAEREKRQKLERELAEASKKEPTPKPNFYDDPEVYVSQAVNQVRAEANERVFIALEAAERDAHSDFDAVTAEVLEAANADPILAQTIAKAVEKAANPAREMYKQGLRLREIKEMQDPEVFRAKLRDEIKAELLKEIQATGVSQEEKAAARQAKADAIPPDISNRANVSAKVQNVRINPVDQMFPKPT